MTLTEQLCPVEREAPLKPVEVARAIVLAEVLAVPNSSLLWSEVSYNYTPVIGYTITGTLSLSDQMFMSPRMTPPVFNSIACT